MTAAEMHDFEKAMMDDPLLSDAVDGYRSASTYVQKDLAQLAENINNAPAKVVRGSFKQWISIAAALVVLLSASVVLYRIFYLKPESKEIAAVPTIKSDSANAIPSTVVDSQTLAVTETQPVPQTSLPVPVIIPSVPPKKAAQQLESKVENNAVVVEDKPAPLPNAAAPAKVSSEVQKEEEIKVAATRQKAEIAKLNKFVGKITDENNLPLPFANITEINSGVGTYSDANGNFVLLSADSVLSVRTKSVGYTTAVAQIKSNTVQRVVLHDEAIEANASTQIKMMERTKKSMANDTGNVDEVEAAPADGWSNYNVYVNNNLRTSADLFSNKQKKTNLAVELSFDVNPDGTLANIKVERTNCSSCSSEAIRVLKEGPRWKSKTGTVKRTRYTVQF